MRELILKKTFVFTLAVLSVLFIYGFNDNQALAESLGVDTDKFKNIQTDGVLEHVHYEESVVSETNETFTVEYTETDGVAAKGNFLVNENRFVATLSTDEHFFELIGKRIDTEGDLYAGEIKNKGTFQALLNKTEHNKYNAIITITLNNGEYNTFSFTGKEATIKQGEYIKNKPEYTTLSDPYYEFLSSKSNEYMETAVAGPNTQRIDAANNHSIRSTTKTAAITQYWRDQGYSAYGTEVARWTVSFTANINSIYNPVNPVKSGTTSFTMPMYIPKLGLQTITIPSSKITLSNPGTRLYKAHFDWYTTFKNGKIDDSGINSKPTKDAFGMIVSWDTTSNIPTGMNYNSVTSSFQYNTRTYSMSAPTVFDSYKTVSQTLTYGVNIIK